MFPFFNPPGSGAVSSNLTAGLTTDHKPDHPKERARIERCGGKVEIAEGGVARVNGNLAVSRGFGDKDRVLQKSVCGTFCDPISDVVRRKKDYICFVPAGNVQAHHGTPNPRHALHRAPDLWETR